MDQCQQQQRRAAARAFMQSLNQLEETLLPDLVPPAPAPTPEPQDLRLRRTKMDILEESFALKQASDPSTEQFSSERPHVQQSSPEQFSADRSDSQLSSPDRSHMQQSNADQSDSEQSNLGPSNSGPSLDQSFEDAVADIEQFIQERQRTE